MTPRKARSSTPRAILLLAAACPVTAACTVTVDYLATNGKIVSETGVVVGGELELKAAKESATHDLQCPPEQVSVRIVPHAVVADGCGQRATYTAEREGGSLFSRVGYRMVLMGRFPLEAAPPPVPSAPSSAPPSAPAGCTRDVECKGDRLCVRGECVSPP